MEPGSAGLPSRSALWCGPSWPSSCWCHPGTRSFSVVIVVGLLVAGGLFFLFMLKIDREVLEAEPGDVGAFKH